MPEHQKVQKRSQNIHSIRDRRKFAERQCRTQQKRRCGSSKRSSSKKRSVSFYCRTKSIRTKWRMQKWVQKLRVCRQERKEEAVMLRRQVTAAWRLYGNKLSPWQQIGLRLCSKGTEEWERPRGRYKSKTKPASSWRCQRLAGAMKALQRVVWSLIFFGRGALGECGGAMKSGTAPSRRPMEEEDASLEDL